MIILHDFIRLDLKLPGIQSNFPIVLPVLASCIYALEHILVHTVLYRHITPGIIQFRFAVASNLFLAFFSVRV